MKNKIFKITTAVIMGVSLWCVFFSWQTKTDEEKTSEIFGQSIDFVKDTMRQCENYTLENGTIGLTNLKKYARVLSENFSDDELTDKAVIEKYATTLNLTGIVIADEENAIKAYAGDKTPDMWKMLCEKNNMDTLWENPHMTYMDQFKYENDAYQYCVMSDDIHKKLVFCCNIITDKLDKVNTLYFGSIIENYKYELGGTVVVTDKSKKIVYSNNSGYIGKQLPDICTWGNVNTMYVFSYEGENVYGKYSRANDGYIYTFATAKKVHESRMFYMHLLSFFLLTAYSFLYAMHKHLQWRELSIQGKAICAKTDVYAILYPEKYKIHIIKPKSQRSENGGMDEFFCSFTDDFVADSYKPLIRKFLTENVVRQSIKEKEIRRCIYEDIQGRKMQISIYPYPGKNNKKAILMNYEIRMKATMQEKMALVVEENELNFEIEEYMLKNIGYGIIRADNYDEAIKILEQSDKNSINLLLVDIIEPFDQVKAAVLRLRSLKRKDISAVPIIAVASKYSQEQMAKCIAVGIDGCITKPLNEKKLQDEIYKIQYDIK